MCDQQPSVPPAEIAVLIEKRLHGDLTAEEAAVLEAALAATPERRAELEAGEQELSMMTQSEQGFVRSFDWGRAETVLRNMIRERGWRLRNASIGVAFWIVAGLAAALVFWEPRFLGISAVFAVWLALHLGLWYAGNRKERRLLRQGTLTGTGSADEIEAHLRQTRRQTRRRHRWFKYLMFVSFFVGGPFLIAATFIPQLNAMYSEVLVLPAAVESAPLATRDRQRPGVPAIAGGRVGAERGSEPVVRRFAAIAGRSTSRAGAAGGAGADGRGDGGDTRRASGHDLVAGISRPAAIARAAVIAGVRGRWPGRMRMSVDLGRLAFAHGSGRAGFSSSRGHTPRFRRPTRHGFTHPARRLARKAARSITSRPQ